MTLNTAHARADLLEHGTLRGFTGMSRTDALKLARQHEVRTTMQVPAHSELQGIKELVETAAQAWHAF